MVIDNDSVKFNDLKDALKEAGFDVEKMNFQYPRKETGSEGGNLGAGFQLKDLSDDACELRAAFNEARGKARLLMILSPG